MAQNVMLLVITFLFMTIQSEGAKLNCTEKGKTIASLDLARDAISKASELYPYCESSSDENETACGRREKSLGYLENALDLIAEAEKNYPVCPEVHEKPIDCSDVMDNGNTESGVYTIWPKNQEPLDVFCDMDSECGGWTVIQRRWNFTEQEDFYRNWQDYKTGFGNISRDFWIGNDNIYAISNQDDYALRFDMNDTEARAKLAIYKNFRISDESSDYTLSVSNYSGFAGDCLSYLNDMKFSTKDRRNDKNGGNESCADSRQSGWWFNTCSLVEFVDCNPNGIYKPGVKDQFKNNYWFYWINSGEGMFFNEMKLKRMDKIENFWRL